jgi:16S rRNA processing protein RimM
VSSSTSSSEAGWLVAGRVGRPHGLDGSFHVSDARSELLREGARLTVGGRWRTVARRAGTDARPILRLQDCTARDQAESLRGQPLLAARADAPAPADGEWWVRELEGCRVHDGGRVVGVVRAVRALPSCDVLEVERDSGEELLVPLVRDAVRRVDVAGRRIDVDLAFLVGGG